MLKTNVLNYEGDFIKFQCNIILFVFVMIPILICESPMMSNSASLMQRNCHLSLPLCHSPNGRQISPQDSNGSSLVGPLLKLSAVAIVTLINVGAITERF